jgi:hypothetical protein
MISINLIKNHKIPGLLALKSSVPNISVHTDNTIKIIGLQSNSALSFDPREMQGSSTTDSDNFVVPPTSQI